MWKKKYYNLNTIIKANWVTLVLVRLVIAKASNRIMIILMEVLKLISKILKIKKFKN